MEAPYLIENSFIKYHRTCIRLAIILLVLFGSSHTYGQNISSPIPLFDGISLQGWNSFPPDYANFWKVKDSLIIGGDGINKISENIYLHSEREFGDFELSCLFRLSGDPGTGMINSGIQYRSHIEEGNMVGYQADIGNGYWGDIYDEHRRAKLMDGDLSTLSHLLREDGWNSYLIRCTGNRHELYINGIKTADYTEQDPQIPSKGIIAFQLHGGGAAKLELRDIILIEIK